jgi:proteic killer suppression protein
LASARRSAVWTEVSEKRISSNTVTVAPSIRLSTAAAHPRPLTACRRLSGAAACQADCNALRDRLQCAMAINGFRHKGLEAFFLTGSRAGIQAKHANRLRLILGRLNVAATPRDMNLPGLGLHELHGPRKGTWAVTVSGNWRVTFRFVAPDVSDVGYEDYH